MKRFVCMFLVVFLLVPLAMAGAETARGLSFADIADLEWTFSSGVGAWYTCVWIDEDGTFTGEFHDSEMGETGEGYPDGSVYGCLFHGKMSLAEQVDETTWKLRVDELALDEGQVPEVIEDGMRFVTSDPYGLKEGHEMLLYLPGTPVEKIPEGYLPWAHLYAFGEDVKELPNYGLYDPQEETGFIGEEPYGTGELIVGAWRREDEAAAEAYSLLILKYDGTGEVLQLPEQISTPLAWYAEGDGWTVCFSAPDETASVRYDPETDTLTLVKDEQATAYYRDWWSESELFFAESL